MRSRSAGAIPRCSPTGARAAPPRWPREVGGEAVGSNRELAERADVVVLAHKPYQLEAVAAEIAGATRIAVTLLARTPQADVRALLPGAAVFRVEPNTPSELGCGVLAFAVPDEPADERLVADLHELFGRLGTVVDVPEHLMPVAGATAGVGPAYVALLAEALDRRRRPARPLPGSRLDAGDRDARRLRGAAAIARPRHAAPAPRRRLARGHHRPRARRARARRGPRRARPGDGRRGGRVIAFASARTEIADFLSALLTVYVIVIIGWIVIQFVFAMGVRVPYSRWSNAILDFLRDTANPG